MRGTDARAMPSPGWETVESIRAWNVDFLSCCPPRGELSVFGEPATRRLSLTSSSGVHHLYVRSW
jgi:hypothetical protein